MVSKIRKEPDISRKDVWQMFDRIAPRYDRLNRLLSFRQDISWRKRLLTLVRETHCQHVLDLATGTGDVLLALVTHLPQIKTAIGIDMSAKMLEIARQKAQARKLTMTRFIEGNAMNLPLEPESFDAVTIAFGIRNVENVSQVLMEMHRVLKPGGKAFILEFSLPTHFLIRSGYLTYLRYFLPFLGGVISGDAHAYHYLNQTIESFPYGSNFCHLMTQAGFRSVHHYSLTFGVATIYDGQKQPQ